MSDATFTAAPGDQAQRDAIVRELGINILVEAAAGTGKTASMVNRMVELLRRGNCQSIATLAAVTFTRKAAAELRARFQAALESVTAQAEGQDRERLALALANIDQCFIGTIHSFCAKLLRERPVEAGVDLAFKEIEPDEDNRLRLQAWAEYTARLIANDPGGILPKLRRSGMTISELGNSFMRFADFPDVDRWPTPDPARDLPPIEPVAQELFAYAKHMRESGPYPPDPPPPSGGRRLFEEYQRLAWLVRRGNPDDVPWLIDILEQFDRDAPSMSAEMKKRGWADFAKKEQARWKLFRKEVAAPFMRAVREIRYRVAITALADAREIYDSMRLDRGALNFQDLLMKSADLLRDKPHIREYFARRFTHLLVDEFQDTDPIQAQIMLYLTATDPGEREWKRCIPRAGSLFVVGDPKQSIYRFRRADIVTYNDVKNIIKDNGRVLEFSANFRATGELIDWTNMAFEGCFPRLATDESPAYVRLRKGRAPSQASDLSGIRILPVPSDLCKGNSGAAGLEYEADLIARAIASAVSRGATITHPGEDAATPVTPGDFMIIAFNKSALSVYARKLQQYGIPHQVSGGTTLSEVWELRLLHTCLDAVTQPDNPVALLGALRSELFGISDAALYAFKAAGGRFDYNSGVPEGCYPPDKGGEGDFTSLAPERAEAIRDAFDRLKQYSRWLQKMPPVAAIERIVAHLGLMALAASREGGDVQAGSVARACELLRAAQDTLPTTADLIGFLGDMVAGAGGSDNLDGISALPETAPAVRILNLHKAKGLQAPVVFLASHKTSMSGTIDTYVDRLEDSEVLGYMGIYKKTTYSPTLRAAPEGWDDLKEIEGRFSDAEKTRLRYVAATRAESMLVVTRQDNGKGNSIWNELGPFVDSEPALADPGKIGGLRHAASAVSPAAVEQATLAVESRMAAARETTYSVRAAKELALSGEYHGAASLEVQAGATARVPEGEHGVKWGEAVHQVLDLVMRNNDAYLENYAKTALLKAGIDPTRQGDLVDTVKVVMTSDIWKRALNADKRLSEATFHLPDGRNLVRGSIDLAFLEDGGWVIVDYKTDAAGPDGDLSVAASKYAPQIRLYARAFETCTGQKVKEAVLYFLGGQAPSTALAVDGA
ncbi:MAG: hypothetical protein CVT63_06610 [Candidatus Anoxymicrobium japonicum]|uniref:DNA 3'-5' helicase n=1 Tax=Candidatus Anoxymicrobium japonicum TaxID=2013648 RepID=A0A2N3G506_9ACTN|nr:MAG: hypothetical protein CVT63_06610 [Candidatus Anoxymicrobium japonicum]